MNTIITIGRQFGSAGREIGEKLAVELGIKCYDKELLTRAAKESGFCEELIQTHDERPTNSFLYNLVMDTYSFGYNAAGLVDMPISQKVFLAQFDAIKKIAAEGPCIIVGRCADYILEDKADCLKVFIHADLEFRAKRIVEVYGERAESPEERIKDKDKRRAAYHRFYTNMKWGYAQNYDLTLNSGVLGIDNCVDIITSLF